MKDTGLWAILASAERGVLHRERSPLRLRDHGG